MGELSKSANIEIKLNGLDLAPFIEWQDISIKAVFDSNIQPAITTNELTFKLTAYTELKNHILNGINGGVGIFEGVPLTIRALNKDGSISAFEGYINLFDNVQIDDENGTITANIRKKDSLNTLEERLETVDFGLLLNENAVTDADYTSVDYVVQPKDETLETLLSLVIGYLMVKELAEAIKTIGKDSATIAGIASGSVTGSAGAIVYLIASIAVNLVYSGAIIVILINIGQDLINKYVQPKRTHKGITIQKMLTKICEYLGYGFNSTIENIDKLVYLPSNDRVDSYDKRGFIKKVGVIEKGVPNTLDFGYTGTEAFELAVKLFNGRYQLIDGVVQLHTEDAEYWKRNSNYKKVELVPIPYTYNTQDLKSNIYIGFQVDYTDIYTVDNFTGTNYQVITRQKKTQNLQAQTIQGFDRVDIPLALGNRKESLTGFENTLLEVARLIDKVTSIGFFGKPTKFAQQIKGKLGVLRVSNNNFTVPKLLYMEGSRIPKNHRELLSAKVLWDNYHIEKSFIANNYKRQRKVISGEETPFGFEDFVKIIENSYFYLSNGKLGKATELEWNMAKDRAVMSYWVEEVYTTNLEEIKIEP